LRIFSSFKLYLIRAIRVLWCGLVQVPPVITPAKGKEAPKVDQVADMETDDGGGDMEMEEDEPAQDAPAQVRDRLCRAGPE
jgi:hypothetical protein